MRLVGLVLVLLPVSAVAQTTTNCTTYVPNNINCTTTGPGPSVQPNANAFGGLINSMPDYSATTNAVIRAQQQQAARERANTATRMIANGDCAGAQRYALSEGDLALASAVKDYCSR